MTKVQLELEITAPLEDRHAERISELHGVYGIHFIKLSPRMDKMTVEFDTTHVTEFELLAELKRAGLPVRQKSQTEAPAVEGSTP